MILFSSSHQWIISLIFDASITSSSSLIDCTRILVSISYDRYLITTVTVVQMFRLKKKFENAIKEMEGRHGLSISVLDSKFEKTISNRPRYQAVSAVKQSMSEKVLYTSMRS